MDEAIRQLVDRWMDGWMDERMERTGYVHLKNIESRNYLYKCRLYSEVFALQVKPMYKTFGR